MDAAVVVELIAERLVGVDDPVERHRREDSAGTARVAEPIRVP